MDVDGICHCPMRDGTRSARRVSMNITPLLGLLNIVHWDAVFATTANTAGFDPLNPANGPLDFLNLGLPPPPPQDDLVGYQNWTRLMELPLPLPAAAPQHVVMSGCVQTTRVANSETSSNWSGAYLRRGGDGRPINRV